MGDLSNCPVVRRTTALRSLLEADTLAQVRGFAQKTSQAMLDRALSWAYFCETEGLCAIERESSPHSKVAAFSNLLRACE